MYIYSWSRHYGSCALYKYRGPMKPPGGPPKPDPPLPKPPLPEGLYLLYSILRLRLLRIGAAVPNLERVVLPLIIRPKGGGYYTRAALIRVRNLLQRIRYLYPPFVPFCVCYIVLKNWLYTRFISVIFKKALKATIIICITKNFFAKRFFCT